MATVPSDSEIAQIAATYSLPPALLLGIVRQEGMNPGFGLTQATLGAYNLSAAEIEADPVLALTVAARTLAQSFTQTGSWDQALSVYLTGDPTAGSSPTSSVGGQVTAIIGQAALNPSFGLSTAFSPASLAAFQRGSQSFGTQMDRMVGSGGAVTQRAVDTYRSQSAQIGSQQFAASQDMQKVAEDILTAAKIPTTDANVALITTMARGEGMPLGDFNWLATTQGQGTGTVPNTPGVQVFASYQQGIDATAQTLLNGNYGSMVALMQQGADLQTIAQNPDVQQNLRTWQGGSSEDVNNLLALKNQPGASKLQQSAGAPAGGAGKQASPRPSAVAEFAGQLQANQIDPQEFAKFFPILAAQRRMMLQSRRTDVSDYAAVQSQLMAQSPPQAMSEEGIIARLRAQPHPTYPNITVGAFQDTQSRASLYSVLHTRQMPTNGEVARLAGLDDRSISGYYQAKATSLNSQPSPPPVPAAPSGSGSGKVAQLGRTQQ